MQKIIEKRIKEGENFEDLLVNYNIEKYQLLSIYTDLLFNKKSLSYEEFYKIKEQYMNNFLMYTLNEKKFIIISDTHLGNQYENLDYLEQIEYFIQKEGTQALIHAGDIGEGLFQSKYNNYTDEIKHILKYYPYTPNIPQYILAGNHDKRYLKENMDLLKILQNQSSNINILGYFKAYIQIENFLIDIEHDQRQKLDSIKEDLRIMGHSHNGKFKGLQIYVPTCSDKCTNKQSKSGFVTMDVNKTPKRIEIDFWEYKFTNNGPEKYKMKKYQKKIKR